MNHPDSVEMYRARKAANARVAGVFSVEWLKAFREAYILGKQDSDSLRDYLTRLDAQIASMGQPSPDSLGSDRHYFSAGINMRERMMVTEITGVGDSPECIEWLIEKLVGKRASCASLANRLAQGLHANDVKGYVDRLRGAAKSGLSIEDELEARHMMGNLYFITLPSMRQMDSVDDDRFHFTPEVAELQKEAIIDIIDIIADKVIL